MINVGASPHQPRDLAVRRLEWDDEFVAERRGVVEIWEEVMREALR